MIHALYACDRCGVKDVDPDPQHWTRVTVQNCAGGCADYTWCLCRGCADEVRGKVMGSSRSYDPGLGR